MYNYRLKRYLSMDGFRARMERVAVITDIHANLPALEAVLDAIEWIDRSCAQPRAGTSTLTPGAPTQDEPARLKCGDRAGCIATSVRWVTDTGLARPRRGCCRPCRSR